MARPGCALCGASRAPHRVDLAYGQLDQERTGDYTVLSVLRGTLLCGDCTRTRTVADLVDYAAGHVHLIHGCLVQCIDRPPWYLRWNLPGGARVWNKTVCPTCQGRASVQIVSEAVDRPRSALREGLRQAAGILSFRRAEEEDEDSASRGHVSGGSDPDPARAGGADDRVPEAAETLPGLADQGAPAPAGMVRSETVEEARAVDPGVMIGADGWQDRYRVGEYAE